MSSVTDSYQTNSNGIGATDPSQDSSLSAQFASQAQTSSNAAPSSWEHYYSQDNNTGKSFEQAGKNFTQGMSTDNAQFVRQGADGSAYIDYGSASAGSYAPQRAHDAFSAGASEYSDDDSSQAGGVTGSYAAGGQGSGSLDAQFGH
jgi:hypothetical protein